MFAPSAHLVRAVGVMFLARCISPVASSFDFFSQNHMLQWITVNEQYVVALQYGFFVGPSCFEADVQRYVGARSPSFRAPRTMCEVFG